MKKNILRFCAIVGTFSLMAFGFLSWTNNHEPDLDLVYKIESRFMTTITKDNLHRATSVLDVVPRSAEDWWTMPFQSVMVTILKENNDVRVVGDGKTFNAEQLNLLQSTDYSNDFYIKARGGEVHPATGKIENYVYYFTVIPEKEAEYSEGHDALIEYLKKNSKEKTTIIQQDKIQPCRIGFTVSKTGAITNVKLTDTSGYPSVDEMLVKLLEDIPGKWQPAENAKGEKVAQDMVFFFGREGC